MAEGQALSPLSRIPSPALEAHWPSLSGAFATPLPCVELTASLLITELVTIAFADDIVELTEAELFGMEFGFGVVEVEVIGLDGGIKLAVLFISGPEREETAHTYIKIMKSILAHLKAAQQGFVSADVSSLGCSSAAD